MYRYSHEDVAARRPSGYSTTDTINLLEETMCADIVQVKGFAREKASMPQASPSAALSPSRTASARPLFDSGSLVPCRRALNRGASTSRVSERGNQTKKVLKNTPLDLCMPKGWVYSYILLVGAWSPRSGNRPGEWRHLAASSGPKKRKKGGPLVNAWEDKLIGMPAAFSRSKSNADRMDGREPRTGLRLGRARSVDDR